MQDGNGWGFSRIVIGSETPVPPPDFNYSPDLHWSLTEQVPGLQSDLQGLGCDRVSGYFKHNLEM